MKNHSQTIIEFFNLAQIAGESFFIAKQVYKESRATDLSLTQKIINELSGQSIAICAAIPVSEQKTFAEQFGFEHVLSEFSDTGHSMVVIDRLRADVAKKSRIDESVDFAESKKLNPVIFVSSQSNPQEWKLWNPVISDTHEELDFQNIEDFDWEEIYERFKNPRRYSQFHRKAKGYFELINFNFIFDENPFALSKFIEVSEGYIKENEKFTQFSKYIMQDSALSSICVTTKLNLLSWDIINSLTAIKVLVNAENISSVTIDGPLPDYLKAPILGLINKNPNVSWINSSNYPVKIVESERNLKPTAGMFEQKPVVIPDVPLLYGTFAGFFELSLDLGKFYKKLPTLVYRQHTLEQVMEKDLFNFFELFGNHPRFRNLSVLWKHMELPNYKLDVDLESFTYPEALEVTIAKAAKRIGENSTVLFPKALHGCSSEDVKNKIEGLISLCQTYRCLIYYY